MTGVLLGEVGAKGRDHIVQQNNGANHLGLRAGNWKLLRQKPGPKAKGGTTEQLFDLSKDPGETTNVAAANPEVVKTLRAQLDAILAGRTRAEK